jgi:Fur family transcriptional regulator, peroxide stress response regulator
MTLTNKQIADRMAHFEQLCRHHGLKITRQRTEVFRELACSEEHPDAETVYRRVRRRIPAISLDTVYRILAALEKLGLIHKAEILFHRGRYDANTDRHHHFVCTQCGEVRDFYSEAMNHLPIPKSIKTLGDIQSTHVQIRGVCLACANKSHET